MKLPATPPLTLAVQAGDESMIRELISAGANIDHSGYMTPLAFALPDLRLAKLLIDAGADLYATGLDHRTALDRAIHRALFPASSLDSLLLVRFFLEAGAHPPEVEDVEGALLLETEYSEAWEVYNDLLPHYPEKVARESFEELEYRRHSRARDGGFEHWTYDLLNAAQQGEVVEIRQTLTQCPERDHADFAKELGLAVGAALSHMHLDAARLLIDAGADVDGAHGYELRRGSSPLTCAAESWHRQSGAAMRLVLEAGANVDLPGRFGRTPLMFATLLTYRHGAALRKAIPILLSAGADPNLPDDFGAYRLDLGQSTADRGGGTRPPRR